MKRTIAVIFIFTMLCLLIENKSDELNITTGLPKGKKALLKEIVGILSGELELGDKLRLKSRWSKEERKHTRQYLKYILDDLGIAAQEHAYRSPNKYPIADLVLSPFQGVNVYGILPATGFSNEYILLGAHYDTGKRRAPGAIDNATGVALIYTVTKRLKALSKRNKNVLIVFFDQEEEENIGSEAFIKLIKKNQWKIHSAHSIDMIGWDSDKDLKIQAYTSSQELYHNYRCVAEDTETQLELFMIDPTRKGSTDIFAFMNKGYHSIGLGECMYCGDTTPYKDSTKDTYDTVDFDYLLHASDFHFRTIKTIINEI